MKSSTAAPSLRNSGLLTTSKKWEADGEDLLAKRSTNARLAPTGTVLLMTIMGLAALVDGQDPLAAALANASATAQRLERSADPSLACGVPTATKMSCAPLTPGPRSVAKRR